VTIDLEKQQVRLRPKKDAKFDFTQFEKAFNDQGFKKVQLLADPKPGEKPGKSS